jgi:hypothetical protein
MDYSCRGSFAHPFLADKLPNLDLFTRLLPWFEIYTKIEE